MDRCERHEMGAVYKAALQFRRHPEGEARLADATRTDEADQSGLTNPADDLRHLALPADEAGEWDGQVGRCSRLLDRPPRSPGDRGRTRSRARLCQEIPYPLGCDGDAT